MGSLLVAGLVVTAPASAAVDTTKPQLTMPPYAQFVVGGQLGETRYFSFEGSWNESIPITLGWSARDASGICSYSLHEEWAGGPPQPLLTRTKVTTYRSITTDYTNQEGGGGGWPLAWRVTARDCAGNQTAKSARITPSLTQDDGSTDGQWSGYVDIAYAGNWQRSMCTCYDAGTVQKTSSPGATVTMTFEAGAQDSVALVMERGANRGRFTVFVDGVNQGLVDTYSRTTQHKVIVWAGRVTTAGNHVITLVNQGTPGRPRIDLDAVLRMY